MSVCSHKDNHQWQETRQDQHISIESIYYTYHSEIMCSTCDTQTLASIKATINSIGMRRNEPLQAKKTKCGGGGGALVTMVLPASRSP